MSTLEIDILLRSLAEWQTLKREQPWITDSASAEAIVERASSDGIESRHFGTILPDDISLNGSNRREGFIACGLNARTRAVLECLEEHLGGRKRDELKIFAPEAVTPFARHMAKAFPGYYGSEFLPEPAQRKRFPSAPHQDLAALSLQEASMDFVLTNDVFEHLPELDRAICEMSRVLRPGGQLLSTFPFAYEREESIRKASLENGVVQFHGEREYHDDPVNPHVGSLVYEIPGWEILSRVEAGGFRDAEMRFIASAKLGICSQHVVGIFVLQAVAEQ